MTISQTPKKSHHSTVEKIPEEELAFHSRRLQIRIFGAISNAFADEVRAGRISRAKLAKRLGKRPEQITRWLAQPSNMNLSTVSAIYLALGGEMKDPSVAFFKDAVEPNYAHPLYDGLEGQTLKHELGYEDQEQRFGITEKQRSQSKSKLRWERGHDSLFNNGQNVAGTRNTMSQ